MMGLFKGTTTSDGIASRFVNAIIKKRGQYTISVRLKEDTCKILSQKETFKKNLLLRVNKYIWTTHLNYLTILLSLDDFFYVLHSDSSIRIVCLDFQLSVTRSMSNTISFMTVADRVIGSNYSPPTKLHVVHTIMLVEISSRCGSNTFIDKY